MQASSPSAEQHEIIATASRSRPHLVRTMLDAVPANTSIFCNTASSQLQQSYVTDGLECSNPLLLLLHPQGTRRMLTRPEQKDLYGFNQSRRCHVNFLGSSCSRISCSWNHAIYLCLRGSQKYIFCHEAAMLARYVLDSCTQIVDSRVPKLRRKVFRGGSIKWRNVQGASVFVQRDNC
ncbi:hypothetical protein L249_7721 [Ophiocordyceps polyrhachis-furcata BCC 54312]|uniref:Uncharacterized protein n=1 Tax=Ophiocordyceps polyrhachis-furcata BCC 54312 TaxID=1330021 RepID=A0A367L9Q9_9HYPO|nr:hypothetical protein L249_7721 [Ophiocordyceps polyrhachis-furcata BCC 54312]